MQSLSSRIAGVVAALAAALTLAGPASAASIRWDLKDVVFADQGTATGYFVIDTVANSVLEWSVTVSPWTYTGPTGTPVTSPTFTYDNDIAGQTAAVGFLFVGIVNSVALFDPSFFGDNPGQRRALRLSVQDSLFSPDPSLETPGVNPLNLSISGECWNCTPFRGVTGGELVGSVPEPSTYALMIGGLLGLGFVARRRRKA
jgi:hypothetical protein